MASAGGGSEQTEPLLSTVVAEDVDRVGGGGGGGGVSGSGGGGGGRVVTARQAMVGVVLMSVAFLWLFTAFASLQNIETSANSAEPWLGFVSLAVLYLVFALAALFLAPAVVPALRAKRSMIAGALGYLAFMAANAIPMPLVLRAPALLVGAVLIGTGASLLWAAQGKYVTDAATNYAHDLNLAGGTKAAMGKFNGIFFAVFQGSQVVGNIMLSAVLGSASQSGHGGDDGVTILFYVVLAVAGVGFALFLFLPSQDSRVTLAEAAGADGAAGGEGGACANVLGALRLLRDRRMQYLVPVLFYSGLEQGTIYGVFTADIIRPSLGKDNIGYVMACFGAVDVVSSYAFGIVCDRFRHGKRIVVAIGFFVALVFWAGLFYATAFLDGSVWQRFFRENPAVLYIAAGVYGLSDATWNVFPGAMLSTMFTENSEAAFSNLKFWQSVAFGVALGWGAVPAITNAIKFACLLAFLVLATVSVVLLDKTAFSLSLPPPSASASVNGRE